MRDLSCEKVSNARGAVVGLMLYCETVLSAEFPAKVDSGYGFSGGRSTTCEGLASVIQTWLKERKGRQVRSRITANTVADAERMLLALTKHEKQLGAVHVTKARKPAARKTPVKRDSVGNRDC